MSKNIQAVRGMRDIPPEQTPLWHFLESRVRQVVESYGYREIRMPMLEMTELFKRSIGEVTDIVEKEMYTFSDRNGDSLTLRPEGTAGCVRAGIELGLLHNQTQRLWYQGPMFRHERPQKGRFRQFHQIGVESYGLSGPDIDLEILLLSARLWRVLGVAGLELQLNSLGTPTERLAYRAQLVDYFTAHRDQLDEESIRRLEGNPLRILDSKNPELADLLAAAPLLSEHLGETSRSHLQTLCDGLTAAGVPFRLNPRLVRGLDYYSRTVFEWVSDRLGAQGTVCAGGRYDGLVEQLGGRATPAVGFALGVERLIALLEENPPGDHATPHLYLLPTSGDDEAAVMLLSERLRDQVAGLRVVTHCGGGGLKARFKRADRSAASHALILGESERQRGVVALKALRSDGGQQELAEGEPLLAFCRALVATECAAGRSD